MGKSFKIIFLIIIFILSTLSLFGCDDETIFTVNFYDGVNTITVSIDENLNTALPEEPTREGFTFGGWFLDNEIFNQRVDSLNNDLLTNNTTIYAKWICSHNFGDWIISLEPTCTEVGSKYRVCSQCGEEEIEIIPALGHDYIGILTAPTCTEQGYTTYTCSRCNDNYIDNYTSALGHQYIAVVSEPTCTEQGYTTYTCSRCNDSYIDDYTVALGHTYGDWIVSLEPTCTVVGSKYRVCSECDEIETESIPALGHNYIAVITEPTCTEQGYTTYTCSRCNDSYIDDYTVALGHTYGDWIVSLEPTCTVVGSKYRLCSVCDEIETESIPALGHNYIAVITEPTPVEDGYTTYTCSRCNDSYISNYTHYNSTYGYDDLLLRTNADEIQELYRDILTEAFIVYSSSEDIIELCFFNFDVDTYGLTIDEAIEVIKIFKLDNPIFYWISNTISVSGNTISISIGEEYALEVERQNADSLILDVIADYKIIVEGLISDYEIAIAIHDKIINDINYSYEADGITPEDDLWAHNIIGVFSKQGAVCEGYSKAYQILLNYFGIENIIVSGSADNDEHMWNLIKLDNNWYDVDVTWDDTLDGAIYYYFGLDNDTFNNTHTADTSEGTGIEFLYELPEISNICCSYVELYCNAEYVGVYASFETAFSLMTDINGDYEIKLSNQWNYVLDVEYMPTVKSLKFTGILIYQGDYVFMKQLLIINDIIANSNIIFENIYLDKYEARILDIQNYELSFNGDYCKSFVAIIGDDDSILNINTLETEFYETIQINTANLYGSLCLRAGNNIINVLNLYVSLILYSYFSDLSCSITDIYVMNENVSIGITNYTDLIIGNIYGLLTQNIRFMVRVVDILDYPNIVINGVIETKIVMSIINFIHSIFTDPDGEIVASMTETCNFMEYTGSIIKAINLDSNNICFYLHYYNQDMDYSPLIDKDEEGCYKRTKDVGYTIKDGVLTNFVTILEDFIFEIPDNVTSIGNSAFFRCNNVLRIIIPNTVLTIDSFAFCDISAEIIFDEGSNLTTLEEYAYRGYNGIGIFIPKSVTNINANAFENVDCPIIFEEGSCLTLIKSSAFSGYLGSSLVLPSSVTTIENYAFSNMEADIAFEENSMLISLMSDTFNGCKGNIMLPDSITEIDNYVFSYWKGTEVTLTSNIIYIGRNAFIGCENLISIVIPESVTNMGEDVFEGCTSLNNIAVSEDNLYYQSIDGVLFNEAVTEIIAYPINKLDNSYTIPSTVISIGERAFIGCDKLEGIILSENIENIGSYAFYGCKELISIYLGEKITNIEYGVFNECLKLTEINVSTGSNAFKSIDGILFTKSGDTIIKYPLGITETTYTVPDEVTTIGIYAFQNEVDLINIILPESLIYINDYAFYGCSNLISIIMPDNVISIGNCSFAYCSNLANINLNDNLTNINYAAFMYCNSLTTISVGENLSYIGDYAFLSCKNLTDINVNVDNKYFISIDGVLYSKSGTILIYYPAGKDDDIYNVPSIVTEIRSDSFSYCKLIKIIIPESTSSLGQMIFYCSENLQEIYINRSSAQGATTASFCILNGCSSNVKIYVPANSVDAYKGMENWSEYASQIYSIE